ncbi:MAG: hypothetical protein ACLQU5_04015 [Isosphaeraceae bacterium]
MSDEQPYTRPEILAHWPVDWRHQWGKVANELEVGGLDRREAERSGPTHLRRSQAFACTHAG